MDGDTDIFFFLFLLNQFSWFLNFMTIWQIFSFDDQFKKIIVIDMNFY